MTRDPRHTFAPGYSSRVALSGTLAALALALSATACVAPLLVGAESGDISPTAPRETNTSIVAPPHDDETVPLLAEAESGYVSPTASVGIDTLIVAQTPDDEAATPVPSPTLTPDAEATRSAWMELYRSGYPEEISVLDLKVGDCISDRIERDETISTVTKITCFHESSAHRVTKKFEMDWPTDGEYPGTREFSRVVKKSCSPGPYLYPSEDSWADGFRTIYCLRKGKG